MRTGSAASTGTKQVRFGANGTYNYGTFVGGVQCSNAVFGDPLVWADKSYDYQTPGDRVKDQCAMTNRENEMETESKRRVEQLRLLLDVGRSVVSHRSLREMIGVVSGYLRQVIHCDEVWMLIAEPGSERMRVFGLDMNFKGETVASEGQSVSVEGMAPPQIMKSLETRIVNPSMLKNSPSPLARSIVASGIQSGCVAPLVSQGRALGTLSMVSRRENAFTPEDAELFTHVAGQLAAAVENALAFREIETLKNKLAEEKLYLEEEIQTAWNSEQIIGESPALKRVLKQIETVASTDSTVLIRGETGTGKELIARAVHNLSARRERTLVKLNCAAIPTGLLESELFGHEKGAFTGAIAQRVGRFELANRGTLFLDEVGDIPPELQPKLLRVLQEQEFERLGSARTQRVDVRLVAATNSDLEQMVADKQFRSDLFYRLNVFPVVLPPLRERREDIPALVRFFAQRFARRMGKPIETVPAETMSALTQYHWPGNVRELENIIERAVILSRGAVLEIPTQGMKPAQKMIGQSVPSGNLTLEGHERAHILHMLEDTDWVIGGPGGAAARLGMKRTTLQSRMQKLGITRRR